MRRSTALTAAASLLLLLAALVAVNMMMIWYGEMSEEAETRRMFRDWMATTKKKYSSADEEEHRYAVFKENRRRFDKRNAAIDAAGLRYTHLGLNVFADLTDEELSSLHTGCVHPGIEAHHQNKGTGGGGQAVSR